MTTVRTGAVTVLTTVGEAVTPGEVDDVVSPLPQEYRELVRSRRGRRAGQARGASS